jgi:uncharacterized protein YcfJ
MNFIPLRRQTCTGIILAMLASALPLATSSCDTPAGRNAVMGSLGGAAIGGLIGGRRAAVAGAITGGLIGAAATPSYRNGYYPARPSSDMSYRHY